jgi:hypothetical protein
MIKIKDWLFAIRFFLLTGCTQRWLSRVWRELIEKDIHPANTIRLTGDVEGEAVEISAFGSQVHVVAHQPSNDPADPEVAHRVHELTVNWAESAGFYVHEKWAKPETPWEMGDWAEVYRQKQRILRSGDWLKFIRIIEANMDQIEDRSHENTMGTEIHEGK